MVYPGSGTVRQAALLLTDALTDLARPAAGQHVPGTPATPGCWRHGRPCAPNWRPSPPVTRGLGRASTPVTRTVCKGSRRATGVHVAGPQPARRARPTPGDSPLPPQPHAAAARIAQRPASPAPDSVHRLLS
ncbi:hypothetical protein [Streptomyces dangxiongensis]|uniref:hypothetical protein n=1 Tax=Streptomyces dangxiongensis TaxID=1442032 RepID=UPI003743DE90